MTLLILHTWASTREWSNLSLVRRCALILDGILVITNNRSLWRVQVFLTSDPEKLVLAVLHQLKCLKCSFHIVEYTESV